MSIAIIFNNKDPEPWRKALESELPEAEVEIYPDIKDKGKVTFALCWKPYQGVLSDFPNLKVVQSVGAAIDHIVDTQTIADDMIVSRIVDEQLSVDMFEFLLAGVMGHMKNLPHYYQTQRQKQWLPQGYQTIAKTMVTILGLGEIGGYVAKALSRIGFQVKGWSRKEKNLDKVACFSGKEGLESALVGTDVLINLLPLTPETENILNCEHLSRLNKGAYLINVGRGEHLVEADLMRTLDEGHLSGALLDVFREEPLPSAHPFWKYENITITPHVAALTNLTSASRIVTENYRRLQSNQELLHTVSLKKGY